MSKSYIIVGGGIAGLSRVISLPNRHPMYSYELRSTPATIWGGGGGIHLVPNALRLFGSLDVEFHECRVDSIEIFSLHTGSQSGYWPYKYVGILSVSI
jgi:salicylate hydroxylase